MQQVRSKHDVKQQTKNKVSLPATSIHGGSPLEDDPQVISMPLAWAPTLFHLRSYRLW